MQEKSTKTLEEKMTDFDARLQTTEKRLENILAALAANNSLLDCIAEIIENSIKAAENNCEDTDDCDRTC